MTDSMAPKTKLILILTFPSGSKYAVGIYEGKFSLVPVKDSGHLKDVVAFDSKEEVHAWMDGFRRTHGDQKLAGLLGCNPHIGRIVVDE